MSAQGPPWWDYRDAYTPHAHWVSICAQGSEILTELLATFIIVRAVICIAKGLNAPPRVGLLNFPALPLLPGGIIYETVL